MKPSQLTCTDMFCGAGGSSIGAELAGVKLLMGMNHWRVAIETHASNFPHADHACVDISATDPRRYPSTHILIASPECTYLSQARTRRAEATLFDPQGADEADRSRATMWDVPRFAEAHRYECIVVENVVEARTKWPAFDAWLQAMHAYGYQHRILSINSLVAHPTPQSRDRLYVVFWRAGNREPDLDIQPRSWCPACRIDVDGMQCWRNGRRWGKYRQQYDYRCASCSGLVAPYAYPAAAAIDWALPAQRIGDRRRPLAAATRRRVEVGLERFGRPLIVQTAGHTFERPGYVRAWPIERPMPTQTTTLQHSILLPFIAELRGGGSTARPVTEPMATVCAQGNHHGLVTPPAFYVKNYGDAGAAGPMAHPVTDPFGAVTTKDHHALVTMPFLSSYYGTGGVTPVDEPVPTLTTKDRHALVEPAPEVDDCGFRMLEPHEQGAAMAFPADYVVIGTKGQRTRQYGAAVTPPVMRLLLERCVESLS